MRVLLDTHALIWFLEGDKRLSVLAKDAIESAENTKLVSTASSWEIAIKSSLGKLTLPIPFAELVPGKLEKLGFVLLEIKSQHLHTLHDLPLHHRDPFDRLILAQASTEKISLITCDPHFKAYGVDIIW